MSLSFHPGHHPFGRRNNAQLAITEPNLGLEGKHITAAVPLSSQAPCSAAFRPGLPHEKPQIVVLASPSWCTGSSHGGELLPAASCLWRNLPLLRLALCSVLVRWGKY